MFCLRVALVLLCLGHGRVTGTRVSLNPEELQSLVYTEESKGELKKPGAWGALPGRGAYKEKDFEELRKTEATFDDNKWSFESCTGEIITEAIWVVYYYHMDKTMKAPTKEKLWAGVMDCLVNGFVNLKDKDREKCATKVLAVESPKASTGWHLPRDFKKYQSDLERFRSVLARVDDVEWSFQGCGPEILSEAAHFLNHRSRKPDIISVGRFLAGVRSYLINRKPPCASGKPVDVSNVSRQEPQVNDGAKQPVDGSDNENDAAESMRSRASNDSNNAPSTKNNKNKNNEQNKDTANNNNNKVHDAEDCPLPHRYMKPFLQIRRMFKTVRRRGKDGIERSFYSCESDMIKDAVWTAHSQHNDDEIVPLFKTVQGYLTYGFSGCTKKHSACATAT